MGPGRQLASLDKVTRGGSSDEASFEQDLDEVKQPGPQRLRGETFQGEGSESTRVQRQVLWSRRNGAKGVPRAVTAFPTVAAPEAGFHDQFSLFHGCCCHPNNDHELTLQNREARVSTRVLD